MTAMTTVQLLVALLSSLFPVSLIELSALIIHCACSTAADVSISLITQLWYLKRMACSPPFYAFAQSETSPHSGTDFIQASCFSTFPSGYTYNSIIQPGEKNKQTKKTNDNNNKTHNTKTAANITKIGKSLEQDHSLCFHLQMIRANPLYLNAMKLEVISPWAHLSFIFLLVVFYSGEREGEYFSEHLQLCSGVTIKDFAHGNLFRFSGTMFLSCQNAISIYMLDVTAVFCPYKEI